jgi:tRNA(Ile)-lysidine synthase
MITLQERLPDNNKYFFACSGGVDSMSCLHWMKQGGRLPYGIIHVHHNTGDYADRALEFVERTYTEYCFDLFVKNVQGTPPKGESKEAWWRIQRYKLFQDVLDETGKDYPIVLAHNLDDCVEQYLMKSCVRISEKKLISYKGLSNTIRPFLTWKKSEIIDYAKRNNIEWIEDPSNTNTDFLRNNIRHTLLPLVIKMNPGIHNQVKKMILEAHERSIS